MPPSEVPHALPALAARRVWLNADHPTLSVGRQPALGLVQQSEFIAEGVANPRAPADCDIERRLHGLAAGADKARDRLVNILNQKIGFRAEVQVHDELGVGVRKSKADCFVAPPQHPMPEAIPIKGDGGVEIGDPKQKVASLRNRGRMALTSRIVHD